MDVLPLASMGVALSVGKCLTGLLNLMAVFSHESHHGLFKSTLIGMLCSPLTSNQIMVELIKTESQQVMFLCISNAWPLPQNEVD